ncbi:helicase SRCAP [Pleurodeles waltl]|uniref:helicase SRCAP n=1 Tax=Pleurodeles waltl TaxID=8319 RepID=UPI0037095BF2
MCTPAGFRQRHRRTLEMQTSPSRQHRSLSAQILRLEDRMTGSNPVSPSSSGSPASSGGVSPLHLGHLMNDSLDGSSAFETPRLQTRASAVSASSQYDSMMKEPVLDKNQADILEQAKHEAEIENRIAELKKEGFWSTRRLSKVPEPLRPKVHWDYLCEEMQWLAADFAQERRWKRGVARKVVRMVIRHHEDLKQKEEKAKREEQAKLRRIASLVAKEVRQFWTNVEKVVQFKQQSRLEEKRKKTLDLQLDFIVGQTEKYSDLLSQSLNETLGPRQIKSSHTVSTASRLLCSAVAKEDEDGDFQPQEEEDDEETIEVEEQQEGNDLETQQREIEQLKLESELPLEELLQSLPQQILASSCSDDDEVEDEEDEQDEVQEEEEEESEEGELEHSQTIKQLKKTNVAVPGKVMLCTQEEEDDEFTANEDEAEDEEETIEAEEALDGEIDHAAELDQLAVEGEMPISELLQRYSALQMEKPESLPESLSSESEQSVEDNESIQSDYSEDEINSEVEEDEDDEGVGVEYLLQGTEDNQKGHPVNASHKETLGPKKEITDIAAAAESLQPKGYTLATTQVKTPVPFLLRGTLREYQHIGLDWLVTMYEKKLNGILADEMGLGKTIQTISLLAHLAIAKGNWGPHLIIVPTSVMLNWEMELKRWCPSFKILTYYGSQKERKLKRQGWTKPNAFHVCITSYKLVLQDHQAFRRKNWKYLILDEAQNIKNFKSQRWQSLLRFNSQRRLLLTGTPLQNSLMELWSLMHFLMPHVFQSHREFKEWFSNPLTGMIEGSQEYNEGLIKRLHKVLRPFLLRRVKVDVEKQMPKKYEHVIHCRLSKRQRYLYDDFMAQAATRETLASGHFMSVINILMQLRKVCNHPNLFDPRPIHSPFITEGICFTTASLALRALERDPFKTTLTTDSEPIDATYRRAGVLLKILQIQSDAWGEFKGKDYSARYSLYQIRRYRRMFQPVPKPEGRPLVMVNSPRAAVPPLRLSSLSAIEMPEISAPVPVPSPAPVSDPDIAQLPTHSMLAQGPLTVTFPSPTPLLPVTQPPPAPTLNISATTTTVTSLLGPVSTPQVLPTNQIPPNTPSPPVSTASTTSEMRASPQLPASVMMPASTLTPVPTGGIVKPLMAQTTSLPGYSFPAAGQVQQRLLLSPDMQARLPSGEVISIAQLASLANRPVQNMPGTKPITFQLHGNRLTLSGPHLRQVTMGQPVGQPRQLQGNVVHLVSAGGQHHIISQPAHVALLQAMTQQQQTQLLQQSGQAQASVQTISLQAAPNAQPSAILPNSVPSITSTAASGGISVPYSAAQASLMNSSGIMKIVVRQTTKDGITPPGVALPQRPAGLPVPGIPTLISPVQRGTIPGVPHGSTALRFPAPLHLPIRAANPQPAPGRSMLKVLPAQAPSVEQAGGASSTHCSVLQASNAASSLAPSPSTSSTPLLGARLLAPLSSPVSTMASQLIPAISSAACSLPASPVPSPLPHSLVAFSSVAALATQSLTTNQTLVQIPSCSLTPSLVSRPPDASSLLPTTLVSPTSSSLSLVPPPVSDSASTVTTSLSLRLTADNSSLTPSLWPLTSTAPILVSSQFSNSVPMLAPATSSGTSPMPTTHVSSSTYLQTSLPPSSVTHLAPVVSSSSLPMQTPTSGNTRACGSAPMLSPTVGYSPASLVASSSSTPTYLQAVTPASSSVTLIGPGQITNSAFNQPSGPIHLQTPLLGTLQNPLLTSVQSASSPVQAHMAASSSAALPPLPLAHNNAKMLTSGSASSFAYVQCSAPVSSPASLLAPVLASSSNPKVATLQATSPAPIVAALVSPNLSPLLASSMSSCHPSLLAPGGASNSASLPTPVPSFNQSSVAGCSTTPVHAPLSSHAALLASVSSSNSVPVQASNLVSSQKSLVANNSPAMFSPGTFTVVSNPVSACVSLAGNCPALATFSDFSAATMLSAQTSVTSSSSVQTAVPQHVTPGSNPSHTLNSVPPSMIVSVQPTSPNVTGRSLVQSIPISTSLGAKHGLASAQVAIPGSAATIRYPLSVSSYGTQLVGSSTSASTKPTQIPSHGTLQGIPPVPSNGIQPSCSTLSLATRLSVSPAQISTQGIVTIPSNGMHLTCPASTLAFTPLTCSSSTRFISDPTTESASGHEHIVLPSNPSSLEPRPLLSAPVSVSRSTAVTLSGPATNLAASSLPVSSIGVPLAPKLQPVCNPIITSTERPLTPMSSPLYTVASCPPAPVSGPLTTCVARPTTPGSNSLPTLANRPPTPINSYLINSVGHPSAINNYVTASVSCPITQVTSSHTTSACLSLIQDSSCAAILGTQPLTPMNRYPNTMADRPLTPVNNSLTTSACLPLTPVYSPGNILGNPSLNPANSCSTTLANRPLNSISSSSNTLAAHPPTPVPNSLSNFTASLFTTVQSSLTTTVAQTPTPVLNPVTSLVYPPLTPDCTLVNASAQRPLNLISSSVTTAAAGSLTQMSSPSATSATRVSVPLSSTILTLTPRTHASMVFKEELEMLTLRSTTPTPPPLSTSLIMPRIRRQPPPPPRSPFYLESLEEKRKRQRKERLDRLFRINERHCAQSPIYGTEILRLCSLSSLSSSTPCMRRDGWWGVGYAHCYAAQVLAESNHLDAYWYLTGALSRAILTPHQRLEQLEHLIDRFIFVMPPVEAPSISVHTCHPSPSHTVQQSVLIDNLQRELGPRSLNLHRIICNMRTQFPDLRLIQYDCGKLQTLDRLLRQLKAGYHRVLIFTQMTRMLDVLEQFLNYHGHIYLRLDGSTRVEQRQSLMDRFNADKRIFCFILSTRSGGVGVNLTGADTVIFYDSDWNPTMDAQAQDRCHRIGQTRDVHIYRLISERTVEENILKKANQKRMLGDMAIEGGNFTTAYFRQQTIRDLFEMPIEEGPKKEVDCSSRSSLQDEDDGAPARQSQILEQALCKAEDEEDIRAATQAKAEQVAELAEFNENIPLDADDCAGREEEEEMSKAEQEIASLVEQLTPIERYAMNFLESSMEDISKEELKQAEEQVEAARKDLDQAKEDIFHLPADDEEDWVSEESQTKRSKRSKAFNRPERPGTRVSERLRGTRSSGLESEDPSVVAPVEHFQPRQEAKKLSLELQDRVQQIRDVSFMQEMKSPVSEGKKLSRALQSSPTDIKDYASPLKQEADELLLMDKPVNEQLPVNRQPLIQVPTQKLRSLVIPEATFVKTELLLEPMSSRVMASDDLSQDDGVTPLLLPYAIEEEQGVLFSRNEAPLQTCETKGRSFEVFHLEEQGGVMPATEEIRPSLPLGRNEVPFVSAEKTEKSEQPETVDYPGWADFPSNKTLVTKDCADLPDTCHKTALPLENPPDTDSKAQRMLSNRLLEGSPMEGLSLVKDQVAAEPSLHMTTSSQDISDTIIQQKSSCQSRKLQTDSTSATNRLTFPSYKGSTEKVQKELWSLTSSNICDVQSENMLSQSKDLLKETNIETKPSPMSEVHKQSVEAAPCMENILLQIPIANHTTMELPSNRDPHISGLAVVVKSNYVPDDGIPQNSQEGSVDGTEASRLTEMSEKQIMTSKVKEINTISDTHVLMTTASSPVVCMALMDAELLHQRPELLLGKLRSHNASLQRDSVAVRQSLGDSINIPGDREKNAIVVTHMEETKTEPNSLRKVPQLQDEAGLKRASEENLCHLPLASKIPKNEHTSHQNLDETSENVDIYCSQTRSSLKSFIADEARGEAATETLEDSSLRTPRRRTCADGEILQNQKEDDSPTAKVLRKLPGRIVTIVEDRVPAKRKRKPYSFRTSLSSPGESSANSISDTDSAGKEMQSLRDYPTRSKIGLETKEKMKVQQREDSSQQTELQPRSLEISMMKPQECDTPVRSELSEHLSVRERLGTREDGSSVTSSATNSRPDFEPSTGSQVKLSPLAIKRKRGRPRKIKPEHSLGRRSPEPTSPDCSSLELSVLDCKTPEQLFPNYKSPEQASPDETVSPSTFPCNKSLNTFTSDSQLPNQSPLLETSPQGSTSPSRDTVESPNRAKQHGTTHAVSPKLSRISCGTEEETLQIIELNAKKKKDLTKATPDQISVLSTGKSENPLPVEKRKRGRPPKVRESKTSLPLLPSNPSSVLKTEQLLLPFESHSNKTLSVLMTNSALPTNIFKSSPSCSAVSTHSGPIPARVSADCSYTTSGFLTDSSSTPARVLAAGCFPHNSCDISSNATGVTSDASSTSASVIAEAGSSPTRIAADDSSTQISDNLNSSLNSTNTISITTQISIDNNTTTSRAFADANSTSIGALTDDTTTPASPPANVSSALGRFSTDAGSSSPKVMTDTSYTPPKRKRGRPPKIQSPPTGEKCPQPSASERESSLDESKNRKPPTKRATRKKRKLRAQEAQRSLKLPHSLATSKLSRQSQLSDSETSSSSESPPLTRLAKVKMDSQGPSKAKGMESENSWTAKVLKNKLTSSPRTEESEVRGLSLSKPDTVLSDKASECSISTRTKSESVLLKKVDDTSQDSSASEMRSLRREDNPRGRCTRQTPSEILLPALEREKRVPRKSKRQSSSESTVTQSRTRTDSDSTSEDDVNRPHKRPKKETKHFRKKHGNSFASESVGDRILRSVAAAAAAAAMSPASNTRSNSITHPPSSNPTAVTGRKCGSLTITTLGNRGRKPKT